jgi:hypothetical protein
MSTPPADRDPRIDPRPGDVLRGTRRNLGKPEIRTILNRSEFQVLFDSEHRSGIQHCSLSYWRYWWAKNAEVIRRA